MRKNLKVKSLPTKIEKGNVSGEEALKVGRGESLAV